jgi:peroxiredoxin
VVLYFFPAAHTKGCNLEAKMFSDASDAFKAQGASIVGVTAGKIEGLAAFSKETEHCGGKFPVAADAGMKVTKQYDAALGPLMPVSSRTSYVIAPHGMAFGDGGRNVARYLGRLMGRPSFVRVIQEARPYRALAPG